MTNVHYFPRYSQKENFVTNNTLLLMYRLYEESRRRFQTFLSSLLDDAASESLAELGLQLRQQTASPKSVLDGFLYQTEIKIGIEAKAKGAPFDKQQLLNHLEQFDIHGFGHLLLLRPDAVDLKDQIWDELHEKAKSRRVTVSAVTFHQIVECFRLCLKPHDDDMHELIDDFENFCSLNDLLGTNRFTAFVPPCGQSFEINVRHKLYFCPSNWGRRNVEYLGIYREKAVQYIGRISKVVHCDRNDDGTFSNSNDRNSVSATELKRISDAMDDAKNVGYEITSGCQFFLCDEFEPTNYRKVSPGGIPGHRYLDIKYVVQSMPRISLSSIADALRSETWL